MKNSNLGKMIKLIVAVCVVTTSLYAAGKKPNFTIHELINLPHPLQAILKNEVNMKKMDITPKQLERLNIEMLAVYPPIIQGIMYKAQEVENQIIKDVYNKNKTPLELKKQIDKLQNLKREVTDKHIESLNVMATILTKKQYNQGLKLFAQMKAKKMYKKLKKQFEGK
ncbi:MAG: hypothetical protein KAJ49_08290 [Arcobacteraceae bacterium]|nr:hypothetical protein [Arcobacteraceae bacterium]